MSDAAKMKATPTGDTINREGMRNLGQLGADPKTEAKIKMQAEKLAKISKVKCDAKVDEVYRYHIPHLSEYIPNLPKLENCFVRTRLLGSVNRSAPSKEHIFVPAVRPQQIEDEEIVLSDVIRSKGNGTSLAFVRAGIRKYVRWNRAEVKAAIITCGGLCPGLNDVVEELVKVLYYDYGVDDIYGIRDGYRGLYEPEYAAKSWKGLKPWDVDDIHRKGGTVLGSARGGFDMNKMMDALTGHGVNQLYIVGGDGSHRAAYDLYEECVRRKLKISIIAIPKTIDNDIGIIDSSFGFNTAIEEAQKSIVSARVEAGCTVNGIGIVKLMGRESGMIAAHATIASREVDVCLIPEVPFEMNGPYGLLAYLERLLKTQGHAVIVVSEGAGEDLVNSAGTTVTGHKILPEIGPFLKKQIQDHFTKLKWEFSIKYHDPSYQIRSVPSNAADSVYCMILAQNAVHGAMAGFTGFSSAVVNNRSVYLPLDLIAATSPVFLNPYGRTYQRVLSVTQQPYFLPANHVFHRNAPMVSKL